MSKGLSLNIAVVLWIGLAAVAVQYWAEVWRVRAAGHSLPPYRHPVLLLSRAAQILYRLWPLALVVLASSVLKSLGFEALHHPVGGQWGAASTHGLLAYLVAPLGDALWVLDSVIFGPLASGLAGTGSLALGLAAAAGLWCAVANPWRLSRRSRVLAAVGALFAVAGMPLMGHDLGAVGVLFAAAGVPFAGPSFGVGRIPEWLFELVLWLTTVGGALGAAFLGALGSPLVWWIGIKRRFVRAEFARAVEASFLVGLAVGLGSCLLYLPVSLLPLAAGDERFRTLSNAVDCATGAVLVVLVWVFWFAASRGGGVRAAFADGLSLAWRRRGDFLLLVARMAAVLAPVWVLGRLRLAPVRGAFVAGQAVYAVAGLWGMISAGLAFASFTGQFPSAALRTSEEALPPDLTGDLPIAP